MSGELFQVATMLVVGTTPPLLLRSSATIPGLRVEWRVQKAIGPSPDQAEIAVYNLAPEARKALSLARSLPATVALQLHVGWGELPELLFAGELWKLTPERRTGTDVLTRIEAADGVAALRDTPPAGGALVGIGVQLAIAQLLGHMQLRPSAGALEVIATAAEAIPVKSLQLTLDGEPRTVLDQLMASIGLSWGVSGGELVVYRGGLRNDLLPTVLTPDSGLLHWEELDDGGVQFEALAQPRLVPGAQLTIKAPHGLVGLARPDVGVTIGGGPLRVETIEFRGSNERESLMTGVARKMQVL